MTEQHREPDADLLYGVPAIAKHMNIRPRQVHHQIDKGSLPVFRMGGVICLRSSTLRTWLAEREAAGREAEQS